MVIYLITNKINGKMYVGQTTRSLVLRWKDHVRESSLHTSYFGSAIKKYGQEAFEISEICSASSLEQLNALECFCIALLNTTNSEYGYNLKEGGGGGGRWTEVMSRKASVTRRAKFQDPLYRARFRHTTSEETKRKIGLKNSLTMKNNWANPQYRKSQIESRVGYSPSEQHRKKVAEGIKKSWDARRARFGQNGRKAKAA